MKQGPPLIVSLVLALVGVGALATAVLLVPPMVRQFAALQPAPDCAQGGTTTSPDAAADPATQAQDAPDDAGPSGAAVEAAEGSAPSEDPTTGEPSHEDAADEDAEEKPAAPPKASSGGGGEWTIVLDESSYEPGAGTQEIIDQVVAALNADEGATVEAVGVNHPNKSSKRARKGANVVRELIAADVGISPRRIKVKDLQDPQEEGLCVRLTLKGGAK